MERLENSKQKLQDVDLSTETKKLKNTSIYDFCHKINNTKFKFEKPNASFSKKRLNDFALKYKIKLQPEKTKVNSKLLKNFLDIKKNETILTNEENSYLLGIQTEEYFNQEKQQTNNSHIEQTLIRYKNNQENQKIIISKQKKIESKIKKRIFFF